MTVALSPPPAVLRIARTLEKAGFEAWCVGGAIRDALLGHPHLDWDLATSAKPEQVRTLFRRTVPVGIAFGTIGVCDDDGVMHEVTTFRRDVNTDGRHAVVEFGASLDEDLARRDYTINAIAYSPASREIRDPFRGRADLDSGVVRAVGEPGERMREDRLRALRALRFAARFGFSIDAATWAAIEQSAPHMGRLSAERVKQEIEKTMDQVRCPSHAFTLWKTSGAFNALIPALSGMSEIDLMALDRGAVPGPVRKPHRRMARMICLFSSAPASVVSETLKSLRFSNADTAWIASIISLWSSMSAEMRFAMTSIEPPGDPVLRRWAAMTGRTRLASVLRLADARWWAEGRAGLDGPNVKRVTSAYRRAIRIAYRDPIEVADLAVNGRDLEKLAINGPAVGQTLRRMLETVINDPALNSRETLLARVEQWRNERATEG